MDMTKWTLIRTPDNGPGEPPADWKPSYHIEDANGSPILIFPPQFDARQIGSLIAAAPELLETLKKYAQADWLIQKIETEHFKEAMRVVAKAEGRS